MLLLLISGDVCIWYVRLVRLCSSEMSRLLVLIAVLILLFLFISGFFFVFTLVVYIHIMCCDYNLPVTTLNAVHMLGSEES